MYIQIHPLLVVVSIIKIISTREMKIGRKSNERNFQK